MTRSCEGRLCNGAKFSVVRLFWLEIEPF
jgi:hypothetical protein